MEFINIGSFWGFFNNTNYSLLLFISFALFTIGLKRRKFFYIPIILALGISLFLSCIKLSDMNLVALRFAIIWILYVVASYFIFDAPILLIVFLGSIAYACQHISYQSHSIVASFLGDVMTSGVPNYLAFIVLTIMFIVVNGVVYFYLGKWKKFDPKEVTVSNIPQLILSTLFLLVAIFLSFYGVVHALRNKLYIVYRIILTFSIICCMIFIIAENALVSYKNKEKELLVTKRLLHLERRQLVKTQENMNLINIKYHDLKHLTNDLATKIDKEDVAKINEAIKVYDSTFKTGCDALDAVLFEKSMFCKDFNVRLTCLVDGSSLNHFVPGDVYVLFGNLLDNALRSVRELDVEKRVVSITSNRRGNLMNIEISNYYNGVIEFENGLPKTNQDKMYHGFGLKSVALIAEKYHGYIKIDTSNNVFKLNFLFTIE